MDIRMPVMADMKLPKAHTPLAGPFLIPPHTDHKAFIAQMRIMMIYIKVHECG